MFAFLDSTGFESAVRDSRVIVLAANNFFADKTEILAIIDDSLRYHLHFLVKVAGVVSTIHDRNPNDETLRNERGTGKTGFTATRHQHQSRQQGAGRGSGSLIKIGNLEISDNAEFSGIKWGDIQIGEHHAPPKPATILQGHTTAVPEHLSELARTAQKSIDEIHFLRTQCEDLLVKSVKGDLDKAALTLRERLAREKRIVEEMNELRR